MRIDAHVGFLYVQNVVKVCLSLYQSYIEDIQTCISHQMDALWYITVSWDTNDYNMSFCQIVAVKIHIISHFFLPHTVSVLSAVSIDYTTLVGAYVTMYCTNNPLKFHQFLEPSFIHIYMLI